MFDKYIYKTSHVPLDLEQGLYKIAKDRPAEWDLICHAMEKEEQLEILYDNKEDNQDEWLKKIMPSWSIARLLEMCFTKLKPDSLLNSILYDLVGKLGMTYFPYAVNVLCHVLSIKDKRIGMMLMRRIYHNPLQDLKPSTSYEIRAYFWSAREENSSLLECLVLLTAPPLK